MIKDIPEVVIEYVRSAFSRANARVSRTLTAHPAYHEESLDHLMVAELSATPPAFFAKERAAISVETHWLGGRRMYGRWEIADIAIFLLVRSFGQLQQQKVGLLQTKRLYSREIATGELEDSDFVIGIGRLIDRTGRLVPLTRQREFSFSRDCVYGAMAAGSDQTNRIEAYSASKDIPVYYLFYNPMRMPYKSLYPITFDRALPRKNILGCRVMPSTDVHLCLGSVVAGKAPTFNEIAVSKWAIKPDPYRSQGWRLENFVADELMRCREGKLFDGSEDENLRSLLYERSAPISSAISITVDVGIDG